MITLLVITILSLAVAAVMSFVAWRLAREERQRSQARVDTLAAEIHADERPFLKAGEYLPPDAPARTQGSLAGALAVGVLFVGSVVGLAIAFSDGARTSPAAAPVANAAAASTTTTAPPLELIALSHERDRDRLIVRGAVRRPDGWNAAAAPTIAVVSAFNRDGARVASGRAPIEAAAGVESTFAVTMAGVDALHRYRVSFRSDDQTVAHVDRRKQAVAVQLP